jgi:hypothetical protein
VRVALGAVAVAAAIIGYVPYIAQVVRGEVKPHAYSWLIWAVTAAVTYAGQQSDFAGPGAWSNAIVAFACLFIFLLALRAGERNITRFDTLCLSGALLTIPLWIASETPLWSILFLTVIDIVAFFPTLRKTWIRPQEEGLAPYILSTLNFSVSIFALDNVSFITALYPAALVMMNGIFVGAVLWRRGQGKRSR